MEGFISKLWESLAVLLSKVRVISECLESQSK